MFLISHFKLIFKLQNLRLFALHSSFHRKFLFLFQSLIFCFQRSHIFFRFSNLHRKFRIFFCSKLIQSGLLFLFSRLNLFHRCRNFCLILSLFFCKQFFFPCNSRFNLRILLFCQNHSLLIYLFFKFFISNLVRNLIINILLQSNRSPTFRTRNLHIKPPKKFFSAQPFLYNKI